MQRRNEVVMAVPVLVVDGHAAVKEVGQLGGT
jgi:hypothetical protein